MTFLNSIKGVLNQIKFVKISCGNVHLRVFTNVAAYIRFIAACDKNTDIQVIHAELLEPFKNFIPFRTFLCVGGRFCNLMLDGLSRVAAFTVETRSKANSGRLRCG